MRIAYRFSICWLLVTIFGPAAAVGDENDGEETFVVIKAGRVITLAGDEIVDGQIVLVNGKVRLVGKDLEYPRSAKVIDARAEVVMPGWIHARTRWQLPSYSRSGVHADRSAAKEIYLEEIDFQPLLKSGFTAVCFYPAGTGIPGPAVVYRTAGKKEHRKLGPAYLRVTMSSPGRDKKELRSAVEKARKEIEKVEKARKAWEEKQKKAKEEAAKKKTADKGDKPTPDKKDEPDKDKDKIDHGETESLSENPTAPTPNPSPEDGGGGSRIGTKNDKEEPPEKKDEDKSKAEEKKPETFTPPKIDPAVKPFVDWIRDKQGLPLLFELSKASDLHHLDDVLKRASELPGTRLYLSGSYSPDYHHIVEALGERKVTVLAHPQIGRLPSTIVRYNLPGELALAGCTVALLPTSDSGSEFEQLRTRLADLVRAGLPREDALKSVTISAAKVLGMEDRLGTIEKDKDGDVVFLDGDPLATNTRVTRVMTLGEIVWEAPEQP